MILLNSFTKFVGKLFTVDQELWKTDDGDEYIRDIVHKKDSVGIIPYDADGFWMVVQRREAVNVPQYMEIPAGTLDVDGESPEECAVRELAEECGLGCADLISYGHFHVSPGWTDETIHLFAAVDCYPIVRPDADDHTEPKKFSHEQIGSVIHQTHDAKSIIALEWLRYGIE